MGAKEFAIRKPAEHTVDVFWGIGWDNWARYNERNGFLTQVKGEKMPPHLFSKLVKIQKG